LKVPTGDGPVTVSRAGDIIVLNVVLNNLVEGDGANCGWPWRQWRRAYRDRRGYLNRPWSGLVARYRRHRHTHGNGAVQFISNGVSPHRCIRATPLLLRYNERRQDNEQTNRPAWTPVDGLRL